MHGEYTDDLRIESRLAKHSPLLIVLIKHFQVYQSSLQSIDLLCVLPTSV